MKIKVGNKNLTIRKWKGKDKKNFLKLLNKEKLDEVQIMEAMVYSCIEEEIILSIPEFKYVLSRIRAYSIGENINIEFYCEDCGEMFNKDFKLSDIYSYTFKNINEIKSNDIVIKLSEIRNKDFYIKKISEDELYDFLLRIESINGNDTMDLSQIEDYFDELDVDVLTDILEQYENTKFKLLDIHTVKCENCESETLYQFDELPGFFPSAWFE